jgi:ubiquitin-protein ligase
MAASIIQQKRFTNEKALLAKEPLHYTTAYPDKENPLIWYCLIIGQKDTPYYGGQYIYKVVHSPKYPAEPPDYYFLTPCGRYEVERKICLTNSSYHKGEWSSTWNIKTILISFYSIFLDDNEHGISHIVPSSGKTLKVLNIERVELAKTSIEYNNKHWKSIYNGFDTSHLSDDAPNIQLIKPKVDNTIVEAKIDIPVVEAKIDNTIVEPKIDNTIVEPKIDIPVVEPKIDIPVVEKKVDIPVVEVKVKKTKKKKIMKVEEDTEILNNILEMEKKLNNQFANIESLEKEVKTFK